MACGPVFYENFSLLEGNPIACLTPEGSLMCAGPCIVVIIEE